MSFCQTIKFPCIFSDFSIKYAPYLTKNAMSHKKAAGSTRNGRDSNAKRLGVKVTGGDTVHAGAIIIRQKGTKFFPGKNVGMGKDYTIFAIKDGMVNFTEKKMKKYDGRVFKDIIVNIIQLDKLDKKVSA